jgi:hypothetical protein
MLKTFMPASTRVAGLIFQTDADPATQSGALNAIVIAVVVLLIAALIGVMFARRRRSGQQEEPPGWEIASRPSLFEGAADDDYAVPVEIASGLPAPQPPATPYPAVDEGAGVVHILRDEEQVPRIRGLLILNLGPSAGLEHIEDAPALGPRAEVIERVKRAVPGLEFSGTGRGHMAGIDHEVRIEIGLADPTPTAVAAASGTAGIDLLQQLLVATGWRAYAARTGSFLAADELHRAASATPHDR